MAAHPIVLKNNALAVIIYLTVTSFMRKGATNSNNISWWGHLIVVTFLVRVPVVVTFLVNANSDNNISGECNS